MRPPIRNGFENDYTGLTCQCPRKDLPITSPGFEKPTTSRSRAYISILRSEFIRARKGTF